MKWTRKLGRPDNWHRWYAWYPVVVEETDGLQVFVWLDVVERRLSYRELNWVFRELNDKD